MEKNELKERIKRKLWGHTELNVTRVNLLIENGVVSLYGNVDGREARATIEGIIRSVEGVDEVVNHLGIHEQDDNLNQY